MNRKLPPNMYTRRWKTRAGYIRVLYYCRFVDWQGIRRNFPAGPDFKLACDYLKRLQSLNAQRYGPRRHLPWQA
jgi:hypothetical protein